MNTYFTEIANTNIRTLEEEESSPFFQKITLNYKPTGGYTGLDEELDNLLVDSDVEGGDTEDEMADVFSEEDVHEDVMNNESPCQVYQLDLSTQSVSNEQMLTQEDELEECNAKCGKRTIMLEIECIDCCNRVSDSQHCEEMEQTSYVEDLSSEFSNKVIIDFNETDKIQEE